MSGNPANEGKLVKLLVGEIGRPVPKGRSRSPGTATTGAGTGAAGTTAGTAGAPAEWSARWSAHGPIELERGHSSPTEAPGPDLTLSVAPDDALAIRQGRLAPSVAFMQGKLKTSGDNDLLLEVLAWTATAAFSEALERLGDEHPAST